jgi:hypothetical protein
MKKILIASLLTSLAGLTNANAYEAHEWGTFTSVVGSNGKSLQGLHHEEESLPSFVYDLSRVERTAPASLGSISAPIRNFPITRGFVPQNTELMPIPTFTERITQKMETPVIYFYSDKEINVDVKVDFPKGIISQWYPKSYSFNPSVSAENGYAKWDVKVLNSKTGILPETSGNSIWNPSRKVNSNMIKAGGDSEKLIFYRGLGDFNTPLSISFKGEVLTIENKSNQDVLGLTLFNNRDNKNELVNIAKLEANSKLQVKFSVSNKSYNDFSSEVNLIQTAKKIIVKNLVASGLYLDESKAMVGTWEKGYFQAKGLRLLYVLPRVWTDEILPLKMTPAPSSLVRTLVGRMEILTPSDEKEIQEFVNSKVANNEVRPFELNGIELNGLGHFPEPKLRRALDFKLSKELKEKVNKLLTNMNSGF